VQTYTATYLYTERVYCVLAPTLNVNCDFTLTFFVGAFLSLPFENGASVYHYYITICNGVKNIDKRHICPCEYAHTFIRMM
jgi:hypothetical protein